MKLALILIRLALTAWLLAWVASGSRAALVVAQIELAAFNETRRKP